MNLVSVCMIVYNHELFIEKAINSILMQKTIFDFEIVIANDASTDHSNELILKATENLPSHITLKYFNHSKNLGLIPNAIFALKQCSGKYISFCEGDDYWIDSNKLEYQINFLENNREFNIVTGAVRRFNQNNQTFVETTRVTDYNFTYRDMIVKNHCPTCATTFKNFIKGDPYFTLIDNRGIDSQIWIRALGKKGLGKYFGKTIAVYRKHDGGASTILHSSTNTFQKKIAYMHRKIKKAKFWNNYFGNEANESVWKVEKKMYKQMLKLSLKNRNIIKSLFFLYGFFKSTLLLKLYNHQT